MFRKQTLGERALNTVHEGIEVGRGAVQAVARGRYNLADFVPAVRLTRPTRPTNGQAAMLFAGGVAACLGALFAWQRGAWIVMPGRRVEDVMVRDVQTIDAAMTLTQAAQRMRDANVGVLPVVENGRVRGIVTDRDLVVRGMARGIDPSSIRVSDVTSRDLIAARPDWPLRRAMETMASHQIGRLPVVDDSDRVIGIVTLSSLALRADRKQETLDTAAEVSRRSARAV